jgi:signal transduction histidine kinase
MAIGLRAEEVRRRTMELVFRNVKEKRPSDAYLEHREARTVLGTLLIGRWLVCGVGTDREEMDWLSQGGAMAARESIPIINTTRGYQHWRDVLIDVSREEAARLDTPAELLDEVLQLIRHSADASLVRVGESYDNQLRAINSQLEAASRFKSEFLAKISHELRTPLTGIIGFSELLLGGTDGELEPAQTEDIELIHRSGQSMLELVNEILDLSRIEAGRMTVEIQAVDLAGVSSQVIDTMRPIAHAKGLTLLSDILPHAVRVMGDPGRIRQVLTNLVANAIKFTPEGSVAIRAKASGSLVEIAVIDTGIGIALEAQDRIFDEFRQADETIATKYGGTGLGLSIARKVVELQGGEMGLESRPGEGSRFWFTLPLAVAENPSAASSEVA